MIKCQSPKLEDKGLSPFPSAYWDISPLSDKQLKEQLVTGEFNSHYPNISQEE